MKEIWILWTALAETIGLGGIILRIFTLSIQNRQSGKTGKQICRLVAIKRTNAQISEMEQFKWDTSNYKLEAKNASSTSQKETQEESLNTRRFQILLPEKLIIMRLFHYRYCF